MICRIVKQLLENEIYVRNLIWFYNERSQNNGRQTLMRNHFKVSPGQPTTEVVLYFSDLFPQLYYKYIITPSTACS